MPPAAAAEALPDHLVLLPDDTGQWALWRTLCVRGAGFPAAGVLRLGDAAAAAAADRANAAWDEAEQRREAALEAVRAELPGCSKERLDVLIKAIQRLKKRKAPRPDGLAAETLTAVETWKAAAAQAEAAAAELRREFAAAEQRLARTLREVARDERFREAVLWQNRHAAATGIASLLRRAEGDRGASRDRAHELMLASYFQRYCTKNDTIGFFGPVGWGRIGEGEERVEARPGPDLLAARQIYFEGWGIDAIAERLAREEGMRPWLAPRRASFIRSDGGLQIMPDGTKVQFGPVSATLFPLCDGTRPARELVHQVLATPGLPQVGEEAVYRLLEDFNARGLISWSFQVPLTLAPERELRERLLALGDDGLRTRALALLDEIVAARDAVARAAGTPDELDRAIGELEEKFTRATGVAPTRAEGATYGARTLIYEDCRRDLDLRFGAPFLAELAPALGLLLEGARWYTYHVARHHRPVFDQVYSRLRREMGSAVLDAPVFTREALIALHNAQVHGELQRDLLERWQRVLQLAPGQRRVAYTSEELRPRMRREFTAPDKGWARAVYHSPDLLVAAPSLEAFRRGDYQVVLGEIHLAVNTLDRGLFVSQHPDPDLLCAHMDADVPAPAIIPLLPKMWHQTSTSLRLGFQAPGVTARLDVTKASAKDFYLDLSLDPHGVPPEQVLRLADLVVEPGEGGLVVGPRDREVRFDILDFFQLAMMVQAIKTFKLNLPGSYMPRISVDRLVLSRESWTFLSSELDFLHAAAACDRFAATRRWAREHGMPRFLFVKTPNERKPFYLDVDNPAAVEIFARAIRQAGGKEGASPPITVSEMLPEPDRTWLPDALGNTYTCELRMVAVDRI